jgi:hypothetical protein
MHENSVERDEELGNDCAILKTMQTTIRIWATPFSYIRLKEFSSYNHLSFFQYFDSGCGAPSKRVEEWDLFNLFCWLPTY